MTSRSENRGDITQTLGLDKPVSIFRRGKVLLFGIIVATLVAGGVILLGTNSGRSVEFKTEQVQQGKLVVTVTATGQLEPVNQVEVGIEVSGTIETLPVDYNDAVKAGQVLAELDTDKFEAQVLESEASLESARAKLAEAQANDFEARNKLKRLKRARALTGGKMPSEDDLDAAEAEVKRAQAEEASAKAQIAQAEAKLKIDRTDLSKAVIRSPINGIVLDRAVEAGQTVAASLQTPVLFTLAEDLTDMELHVDVDEADVGQVKQGQKATFTVDAYPDRSFPALITQVRYAGQTESDVVTYETLLSVDNADLLLRPGMTATADVTVKTVENALLVPNAALRFTPPEPEEPKTEGKGGLLGSLLPRPPRRSSNSKAQASSGNNKQEHVWTLRDGRPVSIPVKVGATNGVLTEVLEGDIDAGQQVILEMITSSK
jgi:HlyD family secretion protein